MEIMAPFNRLSSELNEEATVRICSICYARIKYTRRRCESHLPEQDSKDQEYNLPDTSMNGIGLRIPMNRNIYVGGWSALKYTVPNHQHQHQHQSC